MKNSLLLSAFLLALAACEENLSAPALAQDSTPQGVSSAELAPPSSSSLGENAAPQMPIDEMPEILIPEEPTSCILPSSVPQMDSRVVAYTVIFSDGAEDTGPVQVVTDVELLQTWFPVALSQEYMNPSCEYFGMEWVNSSDIPYAVLSLDALDSLHIYSVRPHKSTTGKLCPFNTGLRFHHRFLVCGKTGEDVQVASLDACDFNKLRDPEWDCATGYKSPFFAYQNKENGILIPYDRPETPSPSSSSIACEYMVGGVVYSCS
jgi:hypothetical protein